jgi:hypothetical protein
LYKKVACHDFGEYDTFFTIHDFSRKNGKKTIGCASNRLLFPYFWISSCYGMYYCIKMGLNPNYNIQNDNQTEKNYSKFNFVTHSSGL